MAFILLGQAPDKPLKLEAVFIVCIYHRFVVHLKRRKMRAVLFLATLRSTIHRNWLAVARAGSPPRTAERKKESWAGSGASVNLAGREPARARHRVAGAVGVAGVQPSHSC